MVIGELVVLGASGILAAALLRIGLMMRPVKMKLPDPASLGLPMAGPASQDAAHAALTGGRRG